MRNGLMVTENVYANKNIGDYIQSIAARQFSPNALYVQRERLCEYDGEPVRMIMNGWFMSNPAKFPPSNKVHPLYVSFHMNPTAAKGMLSDLGIKHLKRYAPIGCRDYQTMDNLRRNGIDAYFSGCLTLTLGRTYSRRRVDEGQIYFVDVAFLQPHGWRGWLASLAGILPWLICNFVGVIRFASKRKENSWINAAASQGCLRRFVSCALFLRAYRKYFDDSVICNANFVTHIVPRKQFVSEDEKFDFADKLLREYAKARLVVTSRIHAALPCLAMGVPVIFVDSQKLVEEKSDASGRLAGLAEHFNVLQLNGNADDGFKFSFESEDAKVHLGTRISNKDSWRHLAEEMTQTCCKFMGIDGTK